MKYKIKAKGASVKYYVGESYEQIIEGSKGVNVEGTVSIDLNTDQEILVVVLGKSEDDLVKIEY